MAVGQKFEFRFIRFRSVYSIYRIIIDVIQMILVAQRLCSFEYTKIWIVLVMNLFSPIASYALSNSATKKESMSVCMIDFAAVSTIQLCLARATFHGALPARICCLIVRMQQGQVHQLMLLVRQQLCRRC